MGYQNNYRVLEVMEVIIGPHQYHISTHTSKLSVCLSVSLPYPSHVMIDGYSR